MVVLPIPLPFFHFSKTDPPSFPFSLSFKSDPNP
jgi:hypothetical protein